MLVIGGPLLNAYLRKFMLSNAEHELNLAQGLDGTT